MSFRPAPTLFITQFAAMAGFLAPVPVLPQIARDLGVSIAAAGQLRTLSGLAAGVVALAAGVLAHRLGVRRLLLAGLCLIAFGSAMSAVAPSFVVLAAAQPPLGAGIAMVLAGGWSAAAAWAPAADRARLLAWAIIGQPAAWVVGMPVIGLVSAGSWRWAWVAVPLASAMCGGVAVARRRPDAPRSSTARGPASAPHREPKVAAWALSELLTYTAWGAVLVYAGAFLLNSYQLAPGDAGMMLGGAAAGFLPGTLLARIGPAINTVAEYRALIEGLKLARGRGIQRLRVFLDSELVVDQVNGRAKVGKEHLKPLHTEACSLLQEFPNIRISWVPRKWNAEADALATEALLGR